MAKKETKVEDGKFFSNKWCVFGKDVFTPVGRAAFVYLSEPQPAFGNAKPKYGLTLLIPKDDEKAIEQLKVIQEMCKKMAIQKFGDKIPPFKYPIFRDGDQAEYTGFPGCWTMSCRNEKGPGQTQGFVILDDRLPEEIEAGMLVRLQVVPMVGEDGFSYKLRGIRLVKDDGVRFNAAPDGASLLKGLDEAVDAVKVKSKSDDGKLGDAFDAAIGSTAAPASNSLDILG